MSLKKLVSLGLTNRLVNALRLVGYLDKVYFSNDLIDFFFDDDCHHADFSLNLCDHFLAIGKSCLIDNLTKIGGFMLMLFCLKWKRSSLMFVIFSITKIFRIAVTLSSMGIGY